jgi:two-component system chemotaxis sensor kinase CheA
MGEFQTVIKPMGKMFENLRGVSGATILGSGEVAVILDIPSLIGRVTSAISKPVKLSHVAA